MELSKEMEDDLKEYLGRLIYDIDVPSEGSLNKLLDPFQEWQFCTSRTLEELCIINGCCKKYSDLLFNQETKLQYVEIGTYYGASVISACIDNENILGITIDLYDPNDTRYGDRNEEAKKNIENDEFNVRDKIKMINKSSAEITSNDLIEKGFNKAQGIHVFFYDGCDDDEGIITNTFENFIKEELFADVCVCIFNQKRDKSSVMRKPFLINLFIKKLGDKYQEKIQFTPFLNSVEKDNSQVDEDGKSSGFYILIITKKNTAL